jgi:hypothetical protein
MSPSWAVARTEWPGCALSRERIDGGWRFDSGARRLLREEDPTVRRGNSWAQKAKLPAEAGIYGLGSRFSPLDKRRSV